MNGRCTNWLCLGLLLKDRTFEGIENQEAMDAEADTRLDALQSMA